ncbi:MAG TPA: DUF5668 domain-containing protein [Bacteroidales bacterium]|jgi:hypothetical protein|nr:hypothetical protein [Bacteroidota bacterium]HJN05064.1 DUF5668 domain-containing protein [Bacteroidales bacterium]
MKFRNIFWGIILILIGLLFTLDNLNLLDFDWYNLWRLWPVVLVLWGISILPVKSIAKIVLVILVLAGSVFYMMNRTVQWHDNDFYISYNHDYDTRTVNQEFILPYEDSVAKANLNMEIAASTFMLIDDPIALINFEKRGSLIDYKYSVSQTDELVDVDIYIEDDVVLRSHSNNRIAMSLNPQPVWDLQFDIGAADVEFDLSGLKINDLDVDGGAAAIMIKLGDEYDDTKVNVETGASSIKVKVPEESGCDLNITSVLSGKTIRGFEKIDHGHYRTKNFNEAENKIYLVIETAISSCSIIRY